MRIQFLAIQSHLADMNRCATESLFTAGLATGGCARPAPPPTNRMCDCAILPELSRRYAAGAHNRRLRCTAGRVMRKMCVSLVVRGLCG